MPSIIISPGNNGGEYVAYRSYEREPSHRTLPCCLQGRLGNGRKCVNHKLSLMNIYGLKYKVKKRIIKFYTEVEGISTILLFLVGLKLITLVKLNKK